MSRTLLGAKVTATPKVPEHSPNTPRRHSSPPASTRGMSQRSIDFSSLLSIDHPSNPAVVRRLLVSTTDSRTAIANHELRSGSSRRKAFASENYPTLWFARAIGKADNARTLSPLEGLRSPAECSPMFLYQRGSREQGISGIFRLSTSVSCPLGRRPITWRDSRQDHGARKRVLGNMGCECGHTRSWFLPRMQERPRSNFARFGLINGVA